MWSAVGGHHGISAAGAVSERGRWPCQNLWREGVAQRGAWPRHRCQPLVGLSCPLFLCGNGSTLMGDGEQEVRFRSPESGEKELDEAGNLGGTLRENSAVLHLHFHKPHDQQGHQAPVAPSPYNRTFCQCICHHKSRKPLLTLFPHYRRENLRL